MSATVIVEKAPPATEPPILKRAKKQPIQPSSNGHHTISPTDPFLGVVLPDHTQLPAEDGTFVKNLQEHPQSIVLTNSLQPILDRLHPDAQYVIGQDSGVYWRYTDPVLNGAEAPDWFYVPNRPPTLNGAIRRSYVMWQERTPPFLVIEFVSGDGTEEHDQTPNTGKFWVYENGIGVPYYAIYDVTGAGSVELFHLHKGRYESVPANQRAHYPIPELGIELGLWIGEYLHATLPWLRVWDSEGNLLLMGDERAEQEHQRAEQEHQRAEQEHQRAEQEHQRAEQERQRAEQERQAKERALQDNEMLMSLLRRHGIELEA